MTYRIIGVKYIYLITSGGLICLFIYLEIHYNVHILLKVTLTSNVVIVFPTL